MSIQEKRALMLSLVADWRSSGLTQKAFCSLHNMKVGTLCYWVARSRDTDSKDKGFVEISGSTALEGDRVEIVYPTGVRLKVVADLGLIAQLIRL